MDFYSALLGPDNQVKDWLRTLLSGEYVFLFASGSVLMTIFLRAVSGNGTDVLKGDIPAFLAFVLNIGSLAALCYIIFMLFAGSLGGLDFLIEILQTRTTFYDLQVGFGLSFFLTLIILIRAIAKETSKDDRRDW